MKRSCEVLPKGRMGTWGLGRGTWDLGRRGRGDAGDVRTRGLGDSGTWGRGEAGTWGRGTRGRLLPAKPLIMRNTACQRTWVF